MNRIEQALKTMVTSCLQRRQKLYHTPARLSFQSFGTHKGILGQLLKQPRENIKIHQQGKSTKSALSNHDSTHLQCMVAGLCHFVFSQGIFSSFRMVFFFFSPGVFSPRNGEKTKWHKPATITMSMQFWRISIFFLLLFLIKS